MALTETQITEVVDRYWREHDRYTKLAQAVGDICRDLVRENAIRASVHWRAKTRESVKKKIDSKYRQELNSVDEAFERIGDLAAVRVLTYVEGDRDTVVGLIQDAFDPPEGKDEIEIDRKDIGGNETFYRATHCQVSMPKSHLVGTYENLGGLSCEIQVCSMLAHIWNELEHDLVYKPQGGNPSSDERELLKILGNQTLAGDGVITQLLNVASSRQKEENEEFSDQYDFVNRLRGKLPELSELYRHSEQALEVLNNLNIKSPQAIQEQVLNSYEDAEARGKELIDKVLEGSGEKWSGAYSALNPESSDVLLALIADKYPDRVAELYPAGRARGRPTRIAYVAGWINAVKDTSREDSNGEGDNV